MATIIDSLLVTFGLDPKPFNAARAQVKKGLAETGAEADKTGAKLQNATKKGSDGFERVAKNAVKFLAVIGGTAVVKRFAEQIIESAAALDRFSKNLGESAETISAWSNAAEVAGGSAEGLQGTMDMLSKSQTELQLTGNSGVLPYLNALGISLATATGRARPVSEIMLDLADRFSRMDRTTANNMGRMMGIDQGTMNLLLKGRSEVELMIRRQRENAAVTKEQAEAASRLRERLVTAKQGFEAFGRALLSDATPALEKVLDILQSVSQWVKENSEFIKTFLTVLTVGLVGLGAATLPINLTVAAVLALAAAVALLWQDYQVWKRGGDSLIDWGKWEPGIKSAIEGLKTLRSMLSDIVYVAIATGDALIKLARGDFKGAWEAAREAWTGRRSVTTENPDSPGPGGAPAATPGTGASGAVAYFQSQGWSKQQAAGLAANIQRESNFNPAAVGDNGQAYGIGQWHPDRQAEFKKRFGKDIRGSSLAEQMAFMQYELTQGGEQAAGNKLRGASSAAQAAAIISSNYERPADQAGEAAARARIAQGIDGIPGASGAAARARIAQGIYGISGASDAASGAGASRVAEGANAGRPGGSNSSVETNIGQVVVHTAATDAKGIARDMGKSLDYLFTSQANPGLN